MQTNLSLPYMRGSPKRVCELWGFALGRWIFPCFRRKKTEGVPLFNANYLTDKSKFEIAGGETPPLQKINIKLRRGGVLPPEKCHTTKADAHGAPYEECANIVR